MWRCELKVIDNYFPFCFLYLFFVFGLSFNLISFFFPSSLLLFFFSLLLFSTSLLLFSCYLLFPIFSFSYLSSLFLTLLLGGSDGVIKRWDLSGDGQKKETEIIRKTDQSIKSTKTEKTEKFENILKNDVTPESEKSMSSTVVIEVPRRRRFLDFYFQDAITAENIRIKSSQSGKQ